MKPKLGDVLADRYRLDRVLGEGGMSMVFAAVNRVTGKQVAIKWLQPDAHRDEQQSHRLLREAKATSAIDHPNVVNVFDVGQHEGALFLVMELLYGEPLSAIMADGPQEPAEFIRLMMPVLRGVQAAHRMGVVHRDLKPDNIFICRDPHGEAREPKILDFGISKLVDERLEPGSELTREGTIFGTPQYMAPEQMRDARVADARSDIYALGVIFYRAFSHRYPYDAETLTALALRIVEGNAEPLHELCPELDRGLSDVVMRSLSLDPNQRFQSIAALAQALEPYGDGVLFAPGAHERELFPSLPRRDSTPSGRDSSPFRNSAIRRATPPRDSTPAARASTTALNTADLFPLTAEQKPAGLEVPPPPPPRAPRPQRQGEIPTAIVSRPTKSNRKRNLILTAVLLLGLASIAPAAWHLWNGERSAQADAPRAPAAGATEERKREDGEGDNPLSTTAPTAPAPHPDSEALEPAVQQIEPAVEPLEAPSRTLPSTSVPAARKRRALPTGSGAQPSAPAATPATRTTAEADFDVELPVQTERNPYLRQ